MSYGVTFSSKLERNHTADACILPTPVLSPLISFSFPLKCVKKLVNLCSFFLLLFFVYVLFFVFCACFFFCSFVFFFSAKARKRPAVRALDL